MNCAQSVPLAPGPVPARNGPLTPLADQLALDLAGKKTCFVAAWHGQACVRCGEPLVPIRRANRIERRRCPSCGLTHHPVGGRWTPEPVAWPGGAS